MTDHVLVTNVQYLAQKTAKHTDGWNVWTTQWVGAGVGLHLARIAPQ